ncbi:YceI family protein [Parasedimentitalea psychrophila]|uniref:YceI family protein n=1 Tax=Parasedimentitalea psychrophila TaxID=2997337 RepID=A0A9Y2KZW4_9RHOB|nr:YceI family protein [Parasedimentitalea psychrophila]WIY25101.1 YceI family protein [Parasedimentitalea psychrophila]
MNMSWIAASFVAAAASAAIAAPEKYVLDAPHSQITFSYNHLGFSTTRGMFSGFQGEVMFDQENPAASSVSVSMPARSMFTGWQERFDQFMTEDFFGADEKEMIRFQSTSIEVTGDNLAKITGDLTLNGVTKVVVLDTVLNQVGDHPMAGKPWAGFDATTSILRSDFDLGKFAPFVSDEVTIQISIEAMKAD